MQQDIGQLHGELVERLTVLGKETAYAADANEPDPRYKGYGVRAPQMKQIIQTFTPRFRTLPIEARLPLIQALMESGFGEQKTIAIHLMEAITDYFNQDNLHLVDGWVRGLHGWSKVDTITARFLPALLNSMPDQMLALTTIWNQDSDIWFKRLSVVLFTRKVAKTGSYIDTALSLCDHLKKDPEPLVQKGVGWCLKDHLKITVPDTSRERALAFVHTLVEDRAPSQIIRYALRDFSAAERAKILPR